MNPTISLEEVIETIVHNDSRYKPDAYVFVMDALSFAQRKFKTDRNVSGSQLLEAIKEFLIQLYGPLAVTVLHHWGVRSNEDFGHIVYNLVDSRIFSKTEDDKFEHFLDQSDLETVFQEDYRKHLIHKISSMRSF